VCIKRIISAVKRVEFVSDKMSYIILRGHWCHIIVEFVSDKMSYIILRGHWCHIIVLNVHAPTEAKTHDVKDSFCEELGRVFDKFLNTT
jgi:hypothetical protein